MPDIPEKLLPKLKEIHGNHYNNAFEKLNRKVYNTRRRLEERGEAHDKNNEISLDFVRKAMYHQYGKKCRYCSRELSVKNMGFDHIVPLDRNGANRPSNIQVICQRCNTRKGPLNHEEYMSLLMHLMQFPEKARAYVLRKLAKGDYNG